MIIYVKQMSIILAATDASPTPSLRPTIQPQTQGII